LVRLVDLRTLQCSMLAGHTDLVLGVAVSPDARRMATCAKDSTVRIYALAPPRAARAPRCVAVCVGHTESVAAIACSRVARDGTAFVVSGSRDLTLKIWPIAAVSDDEAHDARADADADASAPLSDVLVRDESGARAPRRPLASATRAAHEKEINCVALSHGERALCRSIRAQCAHDS
jgi:WD40 repeat protein